MKKLSCCVELGDIGAADVPALELALEDLRRYWERAFGQRSFLVDPRAQQGAADIELLIGAPENHPRILQLVRAGKLRAVQPAEQGFALDIIDGEGRRTAVLRARDRLGLQYAVYGFAQAFLGVRFVHPLLDLQPDQPPMPADLHLVEEPAAPLRVFFETAHLRGSLRGTLNKTAYFTDVGAWRWEDLTGAPERMRHLVAWGVKNGANVMHFDDVFWDEVKNVEPFVVSDSLWTCIDERGLMSMSACTSQQNMGGQLEERCGKENFCDHGEPPAEPWQRHLCVNKPAFWKELDEWLDVLAPRAHRLVGIFSNWQENACSEGAAEGAEDGVTYRLTSSPVDMNSTRLRQPVLSTGGDCTHCGHMTNVEKWVKVSEYLNKPEGTAARGLPPAGIVRTHWGIADPDDGLVAERVVPHLPDGSVSIVSCLPACNRAERVEAWPRIMDEVNRVDNGSRRVMLHRELFYACGSDVPIVPFSNLDCIDNDFRVFGKYESAVTAFGGVYVYHSMGWLLTLRSMRKQWQVGPDWRPWFRSYFGELLGQEAVDRFLEIAEDLQQVELFEGLDPGEISSGHYCYWGVDLNKLAAPTLPGEGDLKAVGRWARTWNGRFLRLVREGAADRESCYTTETCASAQELLRSLRARIDRVFENLKRMAHALPGGQNAHVWDELILHPLQVTSRFLQARVLLALSYLTYIRMRENLLSGLDTAGDAAEGEALCWQAFGAQDEYIRMRPGFALLDYPEEVNPDTLRRLVAWWQEARRDPELCRDLDICSFLDRMET